jgi:hypothetical protein
MGSVGHYKIRILGRGVYAIREMLGVGCALIPEKEKALLIDIGFLVRGIHTQEMREGRLSASAWRGAAISAARALWRLQGIPAEGTDRIE